ncbi:MAG: hypothetical protein N2999_06295, partial [Proteobacteria bacterium]|nr:hypothetical protein [Pseudomonadota bacterium]
MKKLILLLFIILLSSCAPKQQEVKKQRYFWPPPPNDPKIEFIGVYSSSRDLPKETNFLRTLTGDTEVEIRLRKPLNIASDGEGIVIITDMVPWGGYIWDFNQNKVQQITEDAAFQLTTGVAFDSTRFYISDGRAGDIKVFAKKGRSPLYTIG